MVFLLENDLQLDGADDPAMRWFMICWNKTLVILIRYLFLNGRHAAIIVDKEDYNQPIVLVRWEWENNLGFNSQSDKNKVIDLFALSL